MNCPSCSTGMQLQTFAGNYGKPIILDLCFSCGAMWFDGFENLQLTPGAVLQLFKLIHEKRADSNATFDKPLECPRCRGKLLHTSDMQRNTRFFYEACPQQHGRFITFFQFLREKSFVRDLSPKELAELKQRLQMVHCSNCGANVDLTKESQCSYCRSTISMLDPQQMEKTVRDLQHAEERQGSSQRSSPSAREQLRFPIPAHTRTNGYEGIFSTDPLVAVEIVDLVWDGIAAITSVFGDS